MTQAFFVSDLHGVRGRYEKLFDAARGDPPRALFLGGDLLPHVSRSRKDPWGKALEFASGFLVSGFRELRHRLGERYPDVFLILGNDDPGSAERAMRGAQEDGLWRWAHGRRHTLGSFTVYGYACVPPTPFGLKDWERYDVSRSLPPGSIPLEDGIRTVPVDRLKVHSATIASDLAALAGEDDLLKGVFLFHSPPHETRLDRMITEGPFAALAPPGGHIGSVAVRRFIDDRQPMLTMHGHVHESARLTGTWKERLGRTVALTAAHDGDELALVRLDLEAPWEATRELI